MFHRDSENMKTLSVIWTDDLACSASPEKILSVWIKQMHVLVLVVVRCYVITIDKI